MEKKEVRTVSSGLKNVATLITYHGLAGSIHTAASWPTEPKRLVLSNKEQLIWAAYDLFMIAVPICLIVKTGLVILAHHLDVGNTGLYSDQAHALSRYLVSFNSQLVTLFTVIFVTIISTLVKRYALWKAQKGAYVSELEQLQGSVSLASTLKFIWSLRAFNVKSVVLVSIWTFYYLGSQAVKEEYVASNSVPYTNQYSIVQRSDSLSCFTPGINESLASLDSDDLKPTDFWVVNAQFTNVMSNVGDPNNPNLGTNGGPLIPDLDLVPTPSYADDPLNSLYQRATGWVDGVLPVLYVKSPSAGSAAVQIYSLDDTDPILGKYTLNTSYLSIKWSDAQALPIEAFPNGTTYNSSMSLNMTSYRPDAPRDAAGYPLREFEYWYRGGVGVSATVNDSVCTSYQNYAFKAICNVTTKNIELRVSCQTTGCYAHQMRWQNNTNSTAATSYSTPFDSEEFGDQFLSNLTLSTGAQTEWDYIESIDYDAELEPDVPFVVELLMPDCKNCYQPTDPISCQMSSESLLVTSIFNTYLTVSQSLVAPRTAQNLTEEELLNIGSDGVYAFQVVKGALFVRAYRINWAWIPIDFVASFILLAAAIASWRLRLMTLAPDIFGYVSSMTRDNERVPLPTEGSALSGMERARMLNHVKVRIGEVQTVSSFEGESSVGVIGLAAVETNISGLQRQRLYH